MKIIVEEKKENIYRRIFRKPIFKDVKKILFLLLFTFTIPIFVLIINITVFHITKTVLYETNLKIAKVYYLLNYRFSQINNRVIYKYSQIPFIGYLYKQEIDVSQLLVDSNKNAYIKSDLLINLDNLITKFLTGENNDFKANCTSALVGIQSIIENDGFVKIKTISVERSPLLKHFFNNDFFNVYPDLDSLKKYRPLLESLGNAIGDSEKKYILVFQDGTIIRSTGGKIFSLAEITINNGNIVKTTFLSPKDIDSNITGEINSPYPLNTTSKSWSFSDANWSSDINLAAEQVEWFLLKSLGVRVDGVVFLNKIITDQDGLNGSLWSLANYPPEKKIKIIKGFLENEGNIKIFLNDPESNKVFETLGYSENNNQNDCSDCIQDVFKIVESDLNNGSYNNTVEREEFLDVSIQGSLIKKKLMMVLRRVPDDQNNYRLYIRFVVPFSNSFSPVMIDGNKEMGNQTLYGIYRELGVLVDFTPDSKEKRIIVETEGQLNLSKTRSYYFEWIRQPGVVNTLSKLEYNLYNLNNTNVFINGSLTEERGGYYNTDLVPFNKNIKIYILLK